MTKLTINFNPYLIYLENLKYIEDFSNLSTLAYGLTYQLLIKKPKSELQKITLPEVAKQDISFSMADQEVDKVEITCTWLTFEDYAEKCQDEIDSIQKRAINGELGLVNQDPKTGKDMLIWPPEMNSRPLSELPELGKSKFTVSIKTKIEAHVPFDLEIEEDFEKLQNTFLTLAHSVGKLDEVHDNTEAMLFRSCFLLKWTIFEVFLRSTIHELFRKHPNKLGNTNRGKKATLSYSEVAKLSENFSSIDQLRDKIVEKEIKNQQEEGESVHGLINFLNREFSFKNDPYKAWYILNGTKYTTHYNDLLELKEVRNTLIHDGGTASNEIIKKYPHLSVRDGLIFIDRDYYLRASLILKSIAFLIAKNIDEGDYQVEC
jgi:hypothetical protein